ncbi:MAG: acetate--CoA ligase family protein [Candidatus Nanohalobium sp.]
MLDRLFSPETVAVVGASRKEGKTGHEIFDNLLHDFEGEVVPVNPNAEEVHGEKAYDEVPRGTELVVIAVPARIVPDIMDQCGGKNVKAAILVSAGFSEVGNKDLEDEVLEKAEENDIELLGPNVLGLINVENSMNASFASRMPEPGDISFMSQSGAFCTAILDYAKAEHIGFRHFVSIGNKAMINEVDLLEKWREDDTEAILSYTEGIENGRKFLEEAEHTSRETPIIMVKSGRTDEGGDAASSHTGSIAGSYEAYRAAFRKCGIIEAESNRELLDYGKAFAYQPLPEGKNIAVVTNAGGPGVLTADEISEHEMELANFTSETTRKLEDSMPDESGKNNPLDVIGDAGHERYRDALDTVIRDDRVDSIIVILTPQANTEIEKTAKSIVKASESTTKPIMASFMGEKDVGKGIKTLEENDIPDFEDPKDAVKALKEMNEYRKFQEDFREYHHFDYDERMAEKALETPEGYEEYEELLKAYGFQFPLTKVAEAPNPAAEAAQQVGYPAVMKIRSPDVQHKTDIGGVQTGIESRKEAKEAFNDIVEGVYDHRPGSEIKGVLVQEEMEGLEVALGMKRDPQFGPMIMVGLGGIYIEALHDISLGIAPISEQEADKMIEELQSSELFEGVRGKEHSIETVKNAIMKLGEVAMNHDEIHAIDINPLILKEEEAYVADIEMEFEE